ncbi:MAG: hypothetical protein Q6354_09840, partial [Candidatus Brocadiales bacterium]|nr:hypothetical protein [Candidatus Brocadiales bacterium]
MDRFYGPCVTLIAISMGSLTYMKQVLKLKPIYYSDYLFIPNPAIIITSIALQIFIFCSIVIGIGLA